MEASITAAIYTEGATRRSAWVVPGLEDRLPPAVSGWRRVAGKTEIDISTLDSPYRMAALELLRLYGYFIIPPKTPPELTAGPIVGSVCGWPIDLNDHPEPMENPIRVKEVPRTRTAMPG